MRRVRQIMGTPITIDIPGAERPEIFDPIFKRLIEIDDYYSPYKSGSQVSAYQAGKTYESELSEELREIIAACKHAEVKTESYFSAWASGSFDPSGYVKGWAIAEAGKIIDEAGFHTYCIGAGGDIMARSDNDKTWNIGIQDPHDKTEILNKLSIRNGAVATSGSYERGPHIFNPNTRKSITKSGSVSVYGPDIIWADVLATAVYAMGGYGPEFMKTQLPYQAIFVD